MNRVRAHVPSTAGHDDPVPFTGRSQQVTPILVRLVHQTRVHRLYRAQAGEGRQHCCLQTASGRCLLRYVSRARYWLRSNTADKHSR
eukprot:scaffold22443_cov62-Phaeocystis_antarctica.AAC.14